MGDRAAVGVGVDQQDLADQRGGLEGEVDGDGGAARRALGTPDGEQGVRGVAAGGWWRVGGGRDTCTMFPTHPVLLVADWGNHCEVLFAQHYASMPGFFGT